MSSIIHSMLSRELTNIPNFLHSILGKNFNNTLCNGITWLFAFWFILHFFYYKLMNGCLKNLGYAQYLQIRLTNSLWLLAFSLSFFVYFVFTIQECNLIQLANFRRSVSEYLEDLTTDRVLVYAMICSFHLHQAFSQGIRTNSLCAVARCFSLVTVYSSAYMQRFLEIPFLLTALTSLSGIFEEMTKLFYSVLKKDNKLCNLIVSSLYASSWVLFCLVYFLFIPLSFLIPLGVMVFSGPTSQLQIVLFISMMCWLNLAIYNSMVLNSIFHYFYHLNKASDQKCEEDDEKEAPKFSCIGNIIECSLFPHRRDDGYMIALLRSEAKKREKRMNAKRKPKNKNMIIQTLKCMMAIKKKLKEKRADNSDGEDSEESDDPCGEEKKQNISALSPIKASLKINVTREKQTERQDEEKFETELEIINAEETLDAQEPEENNVLQEPNHPLEILQEDREFDVTDRGNGKKP